MFTTVKHSLFFFKSLVICVCIAVPQSAAELADALQSGGGFETTIGRFDSNFSSLLLDLLDKLSIYSTNDCEHSMINIIYRSRPHSLTCTCIYMAR